MGKDEKNKDKTPPPPPPPPAQRTRWTTIVRKGEGKPKETKQKPNK